LQIIKRYAAAVGKNPVGVDIIFNNNATNSPEYIVVIQPDDDPKALRLGLTEEAFEDCRYDEFGANLLTKIVERRAASGKP